MRLSCIKSYYKSPAVKQHPFQAYAYPITRNRKILLIQYFPSFQAICNSYILGLCFLIILLILQTKSGVYSKHFSLCFSGGNGVIFEQQFGHFEASLSIEVLQYGHARVVAGLRPRILLTARTSKNTANIVIRKPTKVFRNIPRLIVVAPAACAAATVG